MQRLRGQNDELRLSAEQAKEAAEVACAAAAAAEGKAAAAEALARELRDAADAARDASLVDRARLARAQARSLREGRPLRARGARRAETSLCPPRTIPSPRPSATQEGQIQAKNKLEHEAAERRQKCALRPAHCPSTRTYISLSDRV